MTPCIVDGIIWPEFAFSILSDTTLPLFSFTVGQPEDIVIQKEAIKPINGRAIYVSVKLDKHVKKKSYITCFMANIFTGTNETSYVTKRIAQV